MAPSKINVKERVSDGEIDLSMSDLQDVPVKEIAVFKKATSLDLSNNHLKTLPGNFATLTHLTKLDLSKNQLSELPEDFGDLVKLKYLDLYQNQLQYLPLSFHKFKALKWLDLKDNPLVPAVAKVAGPCLDAKQCQSCAKDVVSFFTQVQEQIANDLESRQKQRQKQLEVNQKQMDNNKKSKKKEKTKQKKENGPVKENPPKLANKKNKKAPPSPKNTGKASSFIKLIFTLLFLTLSVLFVLTSVKYERTRTIENSCVDLYYKAVDSLSPNLKVYATTVGSYVRFAHDKTGNVTLNVVNYVKNSDNFVNAYDTCSKYVDTMVQKVKEQYKKIVS
ncbi:leucine-rich repeat-containing protein 59 [Tribolium castaneum]|uniref:Leucine-rich repeat-containing protein 59-like Protein n=1 Tax=Tribolium castaneum TaxID=7070 RepID=D6WGK6_TRICA|nr:PREDICTED: leucine-rich repeat-containing protein 59 [Tribolium castaneum]EFA00165.1 Leucine-rich repeat-containing protein 59-like Protein [Tribolium castaneum]|eukprot:XP_971675.1 PREDICTED: leucine-rich repeat-containing protein 59 [Tribolium castaneum]